MAQQQQAVQPTVNQIYPPDLSPRSTLTRHTGNPGVGHTVPQLTRLQQHLATLDKDDGQA
jgi:hypothetical protein